MQDNSNTPIKGNNETTPQDDLQRIPTVGQQTARNLFRSGYETVDMVANSDPATLSDVHGIGKKTAKKIIRHAKTTAQLTVNSDEDTQESDTQEGEEDEDVDSDTAVDPDLIDYAESDIRQCPCGFVGHVYEFIGASESCPECSTTRPDKVPAYACPACDEHYSLSEHARECCTNGSTDQDDNHAYVTDGGRDIDHIQRAWTGQAAYSEEFQTIVTVANVYEPDGEERNDGVVPVDVTLPEGHKETTSLDTLTAVEGAQIDINATAEQAHELLKVLTAGIKAVEYDRRGATDERAGYARNIRKAVYYQHKRVDNSLMTRQTGRNTSDDGDEDGDLMTDGGTDVEAVSGIGSKIAERLRALGIETVGELADAPMSELVRVTGWGYSKAADAKREAQRRTSDSVLSDEQDDATDGGERPERMSDEEFEYTFYPIDDLMQRWDIDENDAEAFLENVGYFDTEKYHEIAEYFDPTPVPDDDRDR